MPLFTFFLDYRGGTYIRQAKARSPEAALKTWASNLDCNGIQGFGPKRKKQLARELSSDEPVAIEGIQNAWCADAIVGGHLALVHFVRTAQGRK